MVSISPVPKLEPGPVSYIHWESAPEPAAPLKSSLNMVDQPDGGPGTAAGAASAALKAAAPAEVPAAGAATAAEAAGIPAAAMAAAGTATVSASLLAPDGQRRMADLTAGGTCNEKLVMTSLPRPAPWAGGNRKVSYLRTESNLAVSLRQQGRAFKSCKHGPGGPGSGYPNCPG